MLLHVWKSTITPSCTAFSASRLVTSQQLEEKKKRKKCLSYEEDASTLLTSVLFTATKKKKKKEVNIKFPIIYFSFTTFLLQYKIGFEISKDRQMNHFINILMNHVSSQTMGR